jgi:UPF0176 protein
MFHIAAFYYFFNVENTVNLQRKFTRFFEENAILGTTLIANEGINGTVAGSEQSINNFYQFLLDLLQTNQFSYKVSTSAIKPFEKLKVKIKNEVCSIRCTTSNEAGIYIEPHDWDRFIQEEADILIDTRNDYEYIIGTFKGAINPKTRNFSEFPNWVNENLAHLNKETAKIAMFCTGGMRCEKTTRFMNLIGFKKTYHLNGGILKYFEDTQNKNGLWVGECFVFDNRIAVNVGLKSILETNSFQA